MKTRPAARSKRRQVAPIDEGNHSQQQALPPLLPQQPLQSPLLPPPPPLPRTLLGPTHGLAALLVGAGGTAAAAADRLEAATVANGNFYCNSCKAKCCVVLRCGAPAALWLMLPTG